MRVSVRIEIYDRSLERDYVSELSYKPEGGYRISSNRGGYRVIVGDPRIV